MKAYNDLDVITSDRITRAVDLINQNGVRYLGNQTWEVDSPSGAPYTCTPLMCSCADHTIRRMTCKHMWAGPGAAAARFILRVRACETVEDLQDLTRATLSERGVMVAHVQYVRAAREEFMARRRLIGACAPSDAWAGYVQWIESVEREISKRKGAGR